MNIRTWAISGRTCAVAIVAALVFCCVSVARADYMLIRGDANGDGEIGLADPIYNLRYQFLEGSAVCVDALDVNDNGVVNLVDALTLLRYLFLDGDAPASPFLTCGTDTTEDELDCGGPLDGCPDAIEPRNFAGIYAVTLTHNVETTCSSELSFEYNDLAIELVNDEIMVYGGFAGGPDYSYGTLTSTGIWFAYSFSDGGSDYTTSTVTLFFGSTDGVNIDKLSGEGHYEWNDLSLGLTCDGTDTWDGVKH